MRYAVVAAALLYGCHSEDASVPELPIADAAPAEETGPTAEEIDTFNRLRTELEAKMREHDVPGAQIAVVLRGKLAFTAGLGVKREGTTDAVGEDTVFRVASMTKPIVTLGVMQLVDAGAISLDAPVKDYVPGFKRASAYDSRALLMKHLLTHSSGIPDEDPIRCSTDPAYLSTWLSSIATGPYWAPPGTLFNYSNPNFTLAAMALQQASGQTFEAYLNEHVLGPAGMTTATFDRALASDDRTSGHLRTGSAKGTITDFMKADCAVSRTYMGIIASAKDYAHLAEKILARDPALLSDTALSDMLADHAPTGLSSDHTSGYGMFNAQWRSRRLHSHDGRAYGWESWFGILPAKGMAVVVLVNADGWGPASFGLHALDAFTGDEDRAAPDYSTPRSAWLQYAGTYNDPTGSLGELSVTWSMDRMFMKVGSLGKTYELGQVMGDSFGFWVNDNPFSGTFFADETGKYMYFASRVGVAKRTGSAPSAFAPPASDSVPAEADFALAISHAHRAFAPR